MKALGPLAIVGVALLLLVPPVGATSPGHYVPRAGDMLRYDETVTLTDGRGTDYSGYSEDSHYNGMLQVTAVASNGTESTTYRSQGNYSNSSGGGYGWQESGTFTFSAVSFLYVRGTDNQTGYTNPSVWFYMDDNLSVGATFTSLNTTMTVLLRNATFPTAASPTGYAEAIEAGGSGSYLRNDSYGRFTATYTWREWFDPSTGYVLGYNYTESDSNSSGNGFTYTDLLTDSATTFPLISVAGSSPGPASPVPWLLLAAVVVVVVIVLVAVAVALVRRRSRGGLGRRALPRHAGSLPPPATYAPPPPISLTPRDQPAVQQIVIKETVKVPCRFCGTLIDSTATACPKCGAPRT